MASVKDNYTIAVDDVVEDVGVGVTGWFQGSGDGKLGRFDAGDARATCAESPPPGSAERCVDLTYYRSVKNRVATTLWGQRVSGLAALP
jgi:hypothetical protein